MNPAPDFDALIDRLPELEQWRLLQDMVASRTELQDGTVRRLDDRMQGFLFLQEYVTNREARIEFARSKRHMPYLRAAAGGHNVWMSDAEFSALVEQNDSLTLACFARSEEMLPHHLAYIQYQLSMQPHGNEVLANAYDTSITLKKALERRGHTREMSLFRLARAALEGSTEVGEWLENHLPGVLATGDRDPRALWRAYRNLSGVDAKTLFELLEAAEMSTVGPVRTSRPDSRALH